MAKLPKDIADQKEKARAGLPKAVSGVSIIERICASQEDNDNRTITNNARIKSDERLLTKNKTFELYNEITGNQDAKPSIIKDITGVRFVYQDPKTAEHILKQLIPGSALDIALKNSGIEILFDELDENLTNPSGLGFSGFVNLKVRITLDNGDYTFAEYQIIHKDMIDAYELSHLFIEEIRTTTERAQCQNSPDNTFWQSEEVDRIKNKALEQQRSLKESEQRKITLLEGGYGRPLSNTESVRIDALKMANAALAASNMLYTQQEHLMRNAPDFTLPKLKAKYGNEHYTNNTVYVLNHYADLLIGNNEDKNRAPSDYDKKRLLLTYMAIQVVECYGEKFACRTRKNLTERIKESNLNTQKRLIGDFVDSARYQDFSKRMAFLNNHIHQNGNDAFRFYERYQDEIDSAAEKLGIDPHKKAKWYTLKNSISSSTYIEENDAINTAEPELEPEPF